MQRTITLRTLLVLVVVLVIGGTTAAFAAVDIDPAAGTGFIGRGDVIEHPLLGKAALVDLPTVSYVAQSRYEQECEAQKEIKEKGKVVGYETVYSVAKQNKKLKVSVEKEVSARKNSKGNVTGYVLSGFVATADDASTAPTDLCSGHNNGGHDWTPKLLGQDEDEANLYATVELVPDGDAELTFTASDTLSGTWTWVIDAETEIGSWVPRVPAAE